MLELNLLDNRRQQRLRDEAGLRSILVMFVELLLILVLTVGALYGMRAYLTIRQREVQQLLASTKIVSPGGKTLPVNETITQLNARLKPLKSILTDSPNSLIDAIAQKLPAGTALRDLTISASTGQVRMSGVAKTRNDVPELQKNLETIPFLSGVSTKSNLTERTNVSFESTAKIVNAEKRTAP